MEEIGYRNQLTKAEENYQRTKMQEDIIFQKLRDMGCRVTKQRRILLNVILQEECASCKEIYYKARREDPGSHCVSDDQSVRRDRSDQQK